MPTFSDLDEYFDPGLTLTVRGKEYTLPLASAELGLWCRYVAQIAGEASSASTDEELEAVAERVAAHKDALPPLPGGEHLSFEERMLGPAYQEMVADKVEDPYVVMCATTAYFWVAAGEDAAARYWTSGGHPEKAAGPNNRAERRAQNSKSATAAASATPRPGSSSGTSSRQRSRRSDRGRRTPGQTS
jgi:hypothetical protein